MESLCKGLSGMDAATEKKGTDLFSAAILPLALPRHAFLAPTDRFRLARRVT